MAASIHLDDVCGAIAFRKTWNKKGEMVDTLAYSDKDEIALDYKAIQDTFGTDIYNSQVIPCLSWNLCHGMFVRQ